MPAHVAFCKAATGKGGPIAAAVPTGAELVADAGTSTVTAEQNDVAIVTATSDVYVAFGTAPTASASTHFLPSGRTMVYDEIQAGWKMAVVAV